MSVLNDVSDNALDAYLRVVMKLVFIGEASSRPDLRPFEGSARPRLASTMGISSDEFLSAVDTANLIRAWPGRGPGKKGRLFPPHEARIATLMMDLKGRAVVLVGKRVALAFGLKHPPWLLPVVLGKGEASCVVMPHPSGIVRWWNSPANRRAAAKVLNRLVRGTKKPRPS